MATALQGCLRLSQHFAIIKTVQMADAKIPLPLR